MKGKRLLCTALIVVLSIVVLAPLARVTYELFVAAIRGEDAGWWLVHVPIYAGVLVVYSIVFPAIFGDGIRACRSSKRDDDVE